MRSILLFLKIFNMASPLDWITGVGGVVSGIGNSIYQHFQSKKALKAQQEENEKNRQFNSAQAYLAYQRSVQQWNRENQYNSPSANRSRLQAAGMNPDLAYGDLSGSFASYGSTTSASSSGSVTPPPMASLTEGFDKLLQSRLTSAQIDNIKANTNKLEHESDILASDAKFRDAYNEGVLKTQNLELSIGESRKKLTDEQAAKERALVTQIDQSVKNFKADYDRIVASTESIKEDTWSKTLNNLFDEATMQSRIESVANELKFKKLEVQTFLQGFLTDLFLKRSQANALNFQTKVAAAKLPHELKILGEAYKKAVTENGILNLNLEELSIHSDYFRPDRPAGYVLRELKELCGLFGSCLGGVAAIVK